MEKGKKCPNCGYLSTQNEEFCPNCDRFEPTFEDFTKELKNEKDLTQKETEQPPITVASHKKERVEKVAEPVLEKVEPQAEVKIEKFTAKEVGSKENVQSQLKEELIHKAEPPVTKSDVSVKPKKNLTKGIAIMACLVILLAGSVFGYTKYQAKKEKERIVAIKKEAALLANDFDKLYFNEEKVFLSDSFSEKNLKDLEAQLADFKEATYVSELKPVASDVKKRGELLQSVNKLFKDPAITGESLAETPILKQAEAVVPAAIEKPADKFEELINQGLKLASNQVADNKKAKELVGKVYGEEPKEGATRQALNDAKEAVKKLKDQSIQKDYSDKLSKVEKVVSEEEKKAETRKEEERKAKIAQAEADQAALKKTMPTTPQVQPAQGTYWQGIALANEGNGTTEGDWSWGAGIQEKIINECLQRGYIVEGGYELRQRVIIDGEPYYNLYATNTQSSLLKGRSASDVPIYLVTINAKTGWFKGEGPN